MTTTTTYVPKVGDIFVSSWGYDQTNITYFRVEKISATGKSIYVREVETVFTGEHRGINDVVVPGEPVKKVLGWELDPCDCAQPEPWCKDGHSRQVYGVPEPNRKTLKFTTWGSNPGKPFFKWTSFANAYLWDGTPSQQTNALYGH